MVALFPAVTRRGGGGYGQVWLCRFSPVNLSSSLRWEEWTLYFTLRAECDAYILPQTLPRTCHMPSLLLKTDVCISCKSFLNLKYYVLSFILKKLSNCSLLPSPPREPKKDPIPLLGNKLSPYLKRKRKEKEMAPVDRVPSQTNPAAAPATAQSWRLLQIRALLYQGLGNAWGPVSPGARLITNAALEE